jgi:3-oxoacyl-[acyl-carrier protein] reductase
MKLHGRNAVVTGGTQGLGRVIVEAFLAEGANVTFCARTAGDVAAAEAALRKMLRPDQRVQGVVCDVSEASAVAALFERAAQFGPLHIVVSNAAIHGPIGPTETVDLDAWNRTWRVNVTGTLLVCQHAVCAMKAAGGGRIVVVSGGGAAAPRPQFAAYAATKAAVVRLAETLAAEVRPHGIAVNAIAPGLLRTRLSEEVVAAGAVQAGAEAEQVRAKLADPGSGSPARAAALCVFLAGAAPLSLTGRLLSAPWDPWETLAGPGCTLGDDDYTLRRIVPQSEDGTG